MAVEVLPVDAKVTAAAANKIIQSLLATRRQRKEQVVQRRPSRRTPALPACIHERFKSGDKTADQLHLYREVGPRVVMVTVKSTADSEEDVKAARAAGEDAALSASFGREK